MLCTVSKCDFGVVKIRLHACQQSLAIRGIYPIRSNQCMHVSPHLRQALRAGFTSQNTYNLTGMHGHVGDWRCSWMFASIMMRLQTHMPMGTTSIVICRLPLWSIPIACWHVAVVSMRHQRYNKLHHKAET